MHHKQNPNPELKEFTERIDLFYVFRRNERREREGGRERRERAGGLLRSTTEGRSKGRNLQ